ncbi:MAG: hypothetical protein JO367_10305, partial [Actinobacteria bacterium]|nr:hypothetical protein [Actinomycetota bacterium]
GMVLVDSGRLDDAVALMNSRRPDSDPHGVFLLNGAAACSAEALIRLGRYADADDLIRTINEQDVGICVSSPQLVPLPMEVRRGNFDEARVMLVEADEMTAGLTIIQTRGTLHILAAELALEEDRPDEAYEQVERGLALGVGSEDETFTPRLCVMGVRALADRLADAEAHGRRGEADKLRLLADAQVQTVENIRAAQVARGVQASNEALALAAQCVAERSRLDVSDATLWAAAGDAWKLALETYPQAYCRWREAEALLDRRADRRRATDALSEARSIAAGLGARPLLGRIDDLARRARLSLAHTDEVASAPDSTLMEDLGLTPREVEVLGLLAAGRTDREIADALFISKKTASVHVSNLLRKLDATNRVEAGRIGQAHGLG